MKEIVMKICRKNSLQNLDIWWQGDKKEVVCDSTLRHLARGVKDLVRGLELNKI